MHDLQFPDQGSSPYPQWKQSLNHGTSREVPVKWSRTIYMVLAPHPLPPMSSACLLSVENFSQRISLIREVRNAETKENSLRR